MAHALWMVCAIKCCWSS